MISVKSVCSILCLLAIVSTANALNIEFNEIAPLTADQRSAFELAAVAWERTLWDPITVDLNIGFDDLGTGILGSTLTARTTHSYDSVRTAMYNDASPNNEKNAVSMLPPLGSSVPIVDINGSRGDNMVTMATANAKALSLGTGTDPTYGTPPEDGADGRILFANAFAGTFDYDPSDGTSAGQTDFVSVATHEIGHALGFFSVTDVQDANPTFTLHPNTLDLWRFAETGGAHAIDTENRRVTAGSAEYYDSTMNNEPFSRGVLQFDAPPCGTGSGQCQASHWRDDQANLMDPTIGRGVQITIQSDDKTAMDYIGYNRPYFIGPIVFPREITIGWWIWPWRLLDPPPPPPIPDFGDLFYDFPRLPDLADFQAPFESELAMRLGLDLGVPGMENRSGVGLALFQEEQDNQAPHIEGLSNDLLKGEQNLEPQRDRLAKLPHAITDFYFVSDKEGTPFTARAVLPAEGAQYDSSLGKHGGYRIPMIIDGLGDGKKDIDARLTLNIYADDFMIPMPREQNVFMSEEGNMSDSGMIIYDPQSLGIRVPQGDYNSDFKVAIEDLNLTLFNWNVDETQLTTEWISQRPLPGTKVGIQQLNDVLFNWGRGATLLASVPEPANLMLIAYGVLAWSLWTRNGARSHADCPDRTTAVAGVPGL